VIVGLGVADEPARIHHAHWRLGDRVAACGAGAAAMPRVGIIDNAAIWDHFRQGLLDLGYIEGRNIAIEYRSAEGRFLTSAGGNFR
jgi:hypothetical protein